MKQYKALQLFATAMLSAGLAGAQGLPSLAELKGRLASTEVPPPAPAYSAGRAAAKDWTIMVFINGKNNLAPYVEKDMNEMETVGSTDKVNIVVEAGKLKQTAPSYPGYPGGWDDYDYYPPGGYPGGWHPGGLPPMMNRADARAAAPAEAASWDTGVRRYYVIKDNDTSKLGSQLLEELPKTDMGDWNKLVEFVKWAKAAYPAKKYMLVVWNHGDGWKTKALTQPLPLTKGISYDDETGNGITTVQLGQALAAMGGVDVYGSDACLMQMAEVVYELRNSVPVIVGSEETEPGDGWDYNAFLSRLPASNITSEAMAKAAVDGYAASYSAKGTAATMSAIYTRDIDNLRYQLGLWVVEVMKNNDKAKIQEALQAATEFEGADSRDLLHFLALAGEKVPALKAKGDEVSALVNKMLIKNAATGEKFKNVKGLGVYLPSYSFDANYSKLAWSAAGNWDEFMQWVTAK